MKRLPTTTITISIFALIIAFFGANQILNASSLVANAPVSIPRSLATIWVYISGGLFILCAISFIIDRLAKPAGYIIAIVLLLIVFTVHLPNIINSTVAPARMLYLTNALKDTAMAMAAIVIGNLSKH